MLAKLPSLLTHLSDVQQMDVGQFIRAYPEPFHGVSTKTTMLQHDTDMAGAKHKTACLSGEPSKTLDTLGYQNQNYFINSMWTPPLHVLFCS